MASQEYKVFPNKVTMFNFFGSYSEEINVSASARLPLNGLALGTKMEAFRSFSEFFARIAELTGLDIDTKSSTYRMGSYIVFFNKPVEVDESSNDQDGDVNQEDGDISVSPVIASILEQAKALNDESDKQGSKSKLIELAAEHGVTLKGNKGFEKLIADLQSELIAKQKEGE